MTDILKELGIEFTHWDFPNHLSSDECASRANALLREKLKDATQVRGNVEFDCWTSEGVEPEFTNTHTGYLVGVKPIGEKK